MCRCGFVLSGYVDCSATCSMFSFSRRSGCRLYVWVAVFPGWSSCGPLGYLLWYLYHLSWLTFQFQNLLCLLCLTFWFRVLLMLQFQNLLCLMSQCVAHLSCSFFNYLFGMYCWFFIWLFLPCCVCFLYAYEAPELSNISDPIFIVCFCDVVYIAHSCDFANSCAHYASSVHNSETKCLRCLQDRTKQCHTLLGHLSWL